MLIATRRNSVTFITRITRRFSARRTSRARAVVYGKPLLVSLILERAREGDIYSPYMYKCIHIATDSHAAYKKLIRSNGMDETGSRLPWPLYIYAWDADAANKWKKSCVGKHIYIYFGGYVQHLSRWIGRISLILSYCFDSIDWNNCK